MCRPYSLLSRLVGPTAWTILYPSFVLLIQVKQSTCGLFIHFPSFFPPQSLLDEPNPNSPANSQAAQLYQENKREYEKRVTAIVEQSWVDVWASLSRSSPSSPSTPLHHPSTSVFHSYLIEKGKITTLSEELKCHPEKKGRMKQPNQNGHYLACQYI